MTESALSDEADALYRPLAELDGWVSASARAAASSGAAPVASVAWPDDPAWTAMVRRGALLAAAHESAALDGMYPGDRALAMSLLAGVSSLADVAGDDRRSHVRANHEALLLAAAAGGDDLASEAGIRGVHAVACRPQLTHPVRTERGVQDHVLAAGDYKHHPNHVRTAGAGWVAHAPVAVLREEMARFAATAAGPTFAALPPAARAAYTLHALTHVAPFADGNGRVARVVASGHLLRATSLPLLVFADEAAGYEAALAGGPDALVTFVTERTADLAQLLADQHARPSPEQVAALDRWRRRAGAAASLLRALPDATERALARHRRRTDLGWLSPLTDAVVAPPSPDRPSSVAVGVPGLDVDEVLTVDAHPVTDEGTVVLYADQAQRRMTATPEDLLPAPAPDFGAALARWLDRVVSTLALRVAAETEPDQAI